MAIQVQEKPDYSMINQLDLKGQFKTLRKFQDKKYFLNLSKFLKPIGQFISLDFSRSNFISLYTVLYKGILPIGNNQV